MMNDWPKAVTTASIWIAVGFALGYGLFKMNFTGDASFFLILFLTGMLMGGAVVATVVVWRSKSASSQSHQPA
jgi:ABC-type glycerol-3-phosphate transport system permease component